MTWITLAVVDVESGKVQSAATMAAAEADYLADCLKRFANASGATRTIEAGPIAEGVYVGGPPTPDQVVS